MGTVMVTGAYSGIGAAFARAFAARGDDLIVVARSAGPLEGFAEELRSSYGVEVECLVCDLADREAVLALARRFEERPVDVLVNNAGFGIHTSLLAVDTRPIEHGFDVMCRAVLILGGAAGRAMRARGSGTIINVSSISGSITMGAYSAVKSWVTAYSESLGTELARDDVTVTALLPGWVRTNFHAAAGIGTSKIPGFLWLRPETVVEGCLRDVARGKMISTPSRRYRVLGWLAYHLPRPVIYAVSARLSRDRTATSAN